MMDKQIIHPPQFCGLYWHESKKTRSGAIYLAQATREFWELWERNGNELKSGGFSICKGTSARATWQVRIFVSKWTTQDEFTRMFAAMVEVNEEKFKRQQAEKVQAEQEARRLTKGRLLKKSVPCLNGLQ